MCTRCSGSQLLPGTAIYSTTKAGLAAFARVTLADVRSYGVKVYDMPTVLLPANHTLYHTVPHLCGALPLPPPPLQVHHLSWASQHCARHTCWPPAEEAQEQDLRARDTHSKQRHCVCSALSAELLTHRVPRRHSSALRRAHDAPREGAGACLCRCQCPALGRSSLQTVKVRTSDYPFGSMHSLCLHI